MARGLLLFKYIYYIFKNFLLRHRNLSKKIFLYKISWELKNLRLFVVVNVVVKIILCEILKNTKIILS